MSNEVNPLHHICGPLSCELYKMEPRIKIDQSINYEIICYVPTKEQISLSWSLAGKVNEPVSNQMNAFDHELAHMLEMCQLERIVEKDFGIKTFLPEGDKRTNRAMFFLVLREVRVRAIQSRLLKTEKVGYEKICGPIGVITNDFSFGRFSNKKELEQYAYELYDRTYAVWTEEYIRYQWDRRLEYIRNWMETK